MPMTPRERHPSDPSTGSVRGFTLVEAATAIGVAAILAGLIIPPVLKHLRAARYARARNDMLVIAGALASQMKDTGGRPVAPGGPAVGHADGTGDAWWFSAGVLPMTGGTPTVMEGHYDQHNSLVNLFTHAGPAGNPLFGLADASPHAEFQDKGPYLARDMAARPDPWGRAYLVLGYNRQGARSGGPIWIVCAGEGGDIADANLRVGGDGAPPGTPLEQHVPVWDFAAPGSGTNLALRVQ
jgi:type II secretory pathway pseudopilin PulG